MFSIALCAFNAAARIDAALGGIAKLNFLGNCEVLVIDNASKDGTAELALEWVSKLPRLRVIQELTPGLGNARIKALREAIGQFICFVDDDNFLAPDYLSAAFDVLTNHPDVALVTGRSKLRRLGEVPAWFSEVQGSFAVGGTLLEDGYMAVGHSPWGAGLVVRRQAFRDIDNYGFSPLLIGRTSERQIGGDDTELCLGIMLLGWKAYFSSTLNFEHAVDPSRLTLTNLRRISIGFGLSFVYLEAYRSFLQSGLKRYMKSGDKRFGIYVLFTLAREMLRRFLRRDLPAQAELWKAKGLFHGYFLYGMRPSTVFGSRFIKAYLDNGDRR